MGSAALAKSLQPVVIFSADEEKSVAAQIAGGRADTDQALASRRSGFGYVSFPGTGSKACIVDNASEEVWASILATKHEALLEDLGYGVTITPVKTDADTAYAAARRHDCRLIVAPADQLAAVRKAADRDGLKLSLGTFWISAEATRLTAAASRPEPAAAPGDAVPQPETRQAAQSDDRAAPGSHTPAMHRLLAIAALGLQADICQVPVPPETLVRIKDAMAHSGGLREVTTAQYDEAVRAMKEYMVAHKREVCAEIKERGVDNLLAAVLE